MLTSLQTNFMARDSSSTVQQGEGNMKVIVSEGRAAKHKHLVLGWCSLLETVFKPTHVLDVQFHVGKR